MPVDRAALLSSICDLVANGKLDAAKASLVSDYPRAGISTPRKSWSLKRLVGVFVRDGFTDRYFGARLVFPGTLRALHLLLTEAFPYHPNWKQSVTHPAFYELYPTIDHVVPIARGGTDDESNVVTTSMLRNGAKANWLLEEIMWPVERAPIAPSWDGLLGWFVSAWSTNELLRRDLALRRWHQAACEANAASQETPPK